ncbi:hypothetical protein K440DRAFT_615906 [Wilcoxina mikolae CBS 423.85]|nr:hypothetical protein K440DRAFT_615906 [Wilcoxina mikolae CBS 423.85]
MPTFPTWRGHKALTGSLVSGFFLLLTSLFGPFILRTIERRRLPPTNSPTKTESKPCPAVAEKPHNNSSEKDETTVTPPELCQTQSSPETELEAYNAFISQLPLPSLTFATVQATIPDCGVEVAKQQRIYRDVTSSGQARTVLEQHQDFGNGRRFRRKLVVYSGGVGGLGRTRS